MMQEAKEISDQISQMSAFGDLKKFGNSTITVNKKNV